MVNGEISREKIESFLSDLNREYLAAHRAYEDNFWLSYMGDHSVDTMMQKSQQVLDDFRTNGEYNQRIKEICTYLAEHTDEDSIQLKTRCDHRSAYFDIYKTPENLKSLRNTIAGYETALQKKIAEQKTGYKDPYTHQYIDASNSRMSLIISTNDDEKVREAAYRGKEHLSDAFADDYAQLILLRNQFARGCGYKNFYAYKAQTEERMQAKDIYKLFDTLSDRLRNTLHLNMRTLEKSMPGLRAPWNFSYMMSGSFTKEQDPYFPLQTILSTRGESFERMSIDFNGTSMDLDLLERKGKYNNGFCHMPSPVHFVDNTYHPAHVNFTCNAIPGQIGSGYTTGATLFHEGGHAAHFANMQQKDCILNTEYLPQSTALAETQSMFLDTIFSSIERKIRYAQTLDKAKYPFDLYEKKVRALHKISGKSMLHIAAVVKFEEYMYESDDSKIDGEYVRTIARQVGKEFLDYSDDTLRLLTIPHIYSWNSSAYYHAYGMAEMAVVQWRSYMYKKYGYIVDNDQVGIEMKKIRQYGSSESPQELRKKSFGKELSPDDFLNEVCMTEDDMIERSKNRCAILDQVPLQSLHTVFGNANIRIVDGKEIIATNQQGFTDLSDTRSSYITKRMKS